MIIFINWSINAGKSTIARLLTNKLHQTANIEVDALRDFIAWQEIGKAIPINLENTVSLILNFTKYGYNTVIPYPLSTKNYEYIKQELNDLVDRLYFFTLAPDIKKAQTSTKDREISEAEYNRIQYHYDIGIPKPSFGIIIDNTNQTPEETANEILSYLSK